MWTPIRRSPSVERLVGERVVEVLRVVGVDREDRAIPVVEPARAGPAAGTRSGRAAASRSTSVGNRGSSPNFSKTPRSSARGSWVLPSRSDNLSGSGRCRCFHSLSLATTLSPGSGAGWSPLRAGSGTRTSWTNGDRPERPGTACRCGRDCRRPTSGPARRPGRPGRPPRRRSVRTFPRRSGHATRSPGRATSVSPAATWTDSGPALADPASGMTKAEPPALNWMRPRT